VRQPHDEPGETFDRIAASFDETRSTPWPFVTSWIEDLGSIDGPLLDVGCGNGRHLIPAMARGYPVIGIDASSQLLVLARDHLTNGTASLALGDARDLPISTGCAGAVMAVAVLHHLSPGKGLERAVSELSRVARPGCRLLTSVWALDDEDVATMARAVVCPGDDPRDLMVPWRRGEGEPVERYYRIVTLDELSTMMADVGFTVVRAWDEGQNHVVEGVWVTDTQAPLAGGETLI
jgi:SAM-dependent methyltransferase